MCVLGKFQCGIYIYGCIYLTIYLLAAGLQEIMKENFPILIFM